MALVKFKAGADINRINTFEAGVLYLDTAANELWFDDPAVANNLTATHQKVIDTDTLVYSIQNSISDPFDDDDNTETCAVLGQAVLGRMILGTS